MIRLYFGTPYESFRRRTLTMMEDRGYSLPAHFDWGSETEVNGVFDLASAQTLYDGPPAHVPAGQAVHRLLIALSQDFYKPSPLLSLFSQLYPDEVFNPDSSPSRVRQIIMRLRKWLRDSKLALRLDEDAGSYRLAFTGALGIRVPREALSLEPRELKLLRLRQSLVPTQPFFGTAEVVERLDSSKAVVKRLLKWAVDSGRLVREGQGSHIRYRFTA